MGLDPLDPPLADNNKLGWHIPDIKLHDLENTLEDYLALYLFARKLKI